MTGRDPRGLKGSLARVEVRTSRSYPVYIGPGALAEVRSIAGEDRSLAVLSDRNVAPLYRTALIGLEQAPLLELEPGEESKSLDVLGQVLDFLVAAGLDRDSRLVALGGGVVGDVGGLAASLFMRGIEWIACPTSTQSQVDAAVGGKNAINLAGGKNLAGTFHQPAAVLADTETLATLEADEHRSGLGEVVKTALLDRGTLLELLERQAVPALAREPGVMAEIVERCVQIKGAVVARDERESGERRVLNLGHTFAHAIERAAGYGTVPHGLAVGVGLCLALRCSRELGRLEQPELPERVELLLGRLGLPVSLAELRPRAGEELEPAALVEGMRHDKKGRPAEPALVLPRALGRVDVGVRAEPGFLADFLARESG